MGFTDVIRIKLIGGDGGDGGVKYLQGKKPMGGKGGKGGDVWVEGTSNIFDLNFLDENQTFKAEKGQLGKEYRMEGETGESVTIKLPLVTEIYNNNQELLCRIEKPGQRFLVAKGGDGGEGNYFFRAGQEDTYGKFTHGEKGKMIMAELVLKLKADVVFIGLPNAGKSSLLNAITHSKAKVANYPFTTLSPNLGVVPGIVFMDLPGIIEGTAEGKGLGSGFAKHTEAAQLVAHILSLESDDLMRDYTIIRKELEKISDDLYNKKEIIVLTKSDQFLDEEIEAKKKELSSLNAQFIVCSSYQKETIEKLVDEIGKMLKL